MSEAAGLVAAVSSKALDSGTYYSFCIDDIWYRTGRDPIPFEKGHTVKFEFEENKYGKQVDLSSLKVKEGKTTVTRSASNAGAKKSDYQQKEQYWKDKDLRDIATQKQIRMAGALNTAISMVTNAIASECLAAPKGKAAARFEAYTAMVQEEAERLYKVIFEAPLHHDALTKVVLVEDGGFDVSDLQSESLGEPEDTDEWS